MNGKYGIIKGQKVALALLETTEGVRQKGKLMSVDNDTTLHCIYRIVNFKDGKCYIGQTKNPKKRKQEHFYKLSKGTHSNCILQDAYNRYGESSFYFEILESDVQNCDINRHEIDWIAAAQIDHLLYNIAVGGKDVNWKGSEKPCTWNGKSYKSRVHAAAALGISPGSMSKRIRCGHTCDSDLTQMIHNKSCSWNGITYDTVTDAAKACGVTPESMILRYKRGHTCDTDLKFLPKTSRYHQVGIECVWNGKHYASIHAAARDLGIDANSMRKRIKRGHTCDADLDKRHQPRPR